MSAVIILILCLFSYVTGYAFLKITRFREPVTGDYFCTGFFVMLGIAGGANILGIAMRLPLGKLCTLCGVIYAVCFLCATAFRFLSYQKNKALPQAKSLFESGGRGQTYIAFATGIVFLLLFIITQITPNIYISEDITLETVRTFLSTDSIYGANPLTGEAYTAGIPNRLKILSLTFFYAFVSKLFPMVDAGIIVWRMMPGFVLVLAFFAYSSLSAALFEERKNRLIFMLIVGIVLFMSDYISGADGFALLQAGFRGVSIRALVLMPYTLSLLYRKRWCFCILSVLAEALTVWTLYGAGAVLLLCVMFFAFEKVSERIKRRYERAH